MTDMLRRQLAALSEEMKPVDLYDRVIAGSARVARRNRALGSAGAATAVAAVVFAVTSLRPVEVGPNTFSPSPSPSSSPRAWAFPTPSPRPSVDPVAAGPLRDAKLEIVIPVGRGVCQFAGGLGEVQINALYDARLYSSTVFADRPIGAALIEIQHGKNTTPLRQIHIYRMADPTRDAVLLDKWPGEFHDATKVEAVGHDLHVTIKGEVKVYPIP